MQWTNIKYEKPTDSGPCLVSLSIKESNGNEYFFNYYAFYNNDTGRFHDYESETGKVGNIIDKKIIGWLKGLPNYLG